MKKFKTLSMLIICVLLIGLLPIKSSAAVKLSKTKASMCVGETLKLKVTGTSKTAKWSSSKKSVATVSKSGKVTAKKEGTTTITAKVSGKKYSCKITIKAKSLDSLKKYLSKKGLVSGDASETAYQIIGANDGVKYLDNNIEIYEYDTNSDVYKNIVKNNSVDLQGFNIQLNVSAINGKFILIFSNDETNEKVIKAFKDF